MELPDCPATPADTDIPLAVMPEDNAGIATCKKKQKKAAADAGPTPSDKLHQKKWVELPDCPATFGPNDFALADDVSNASAATCKKKPAAAPAPAALNQKNWVELPDCPKKLGDNDVALADDVSNATSATCKKRKPAATAPAAAALA